LAFRLLCKMGRAEGIAAVGTDLGMALRGLRRYSEARAVWTQARDAYRKLGRQDEVARLNKLLAKLPRQDPPATGA
jgi:hypothetical protein